MIPILSLHNVVKKYSNFILGPISFNLEKGKILALLGPNGAGKTTTFDCISSMVEHQSGLIKICGLNNDPNESNWKNLVAYVNSTPSHIKTMKGLEYLQYIAKYYKTWNYDYMNDLIKKLELPCDQKIEKFSSGNITKIELISALSYQPRLLLLDEPTNALDPLVREIFVDIIFDYMASGENSVIWSSHIIPEVANIADDFAFLMNGKMEEISSKIDLTENWRTIIVEKSDFSELIPNALDIKQVDNNFIEIISNNYSNTTEFLKEKNIKIHEELYLNIELICIKNMLRYKQISK